MKLAIPFAIFLIPVFTLLWRVGNRAHYEVWLSQATETALADSPWTYGVDVQFDHLDGIAYGIALNRDDRSAMMDAVRTACPRYADRVQNRILIEGTEPLLSEDLDALQAEMRDRLGALHFVARADKLPRYHDTELVQIAELFLQSDSQVGLLLVGRTDAAGAADYNLELGHRRADHLRKKLVEFGCPPHRIGAASLGEAAASADPDDPTSRRVDLYLIPEVN